MKRTCSLLCAIALLTACSGVPLRALPRLAHLGSDLMYADPAELALAIAADVRMVPPAAGAPVLQLAIKPATAGAFEAVDRKFPMQFATAGAATEDLPAPGAGRRWLIYRLSPETREEIGALRERFRKLQASGGGKVGTVSIGIAQDGVAARDPALADTAWECWLRTSRTEGFFRMWSGTVGEVLAQGESR